MNVPVAVEVWDGHHRLAAAILSGKYKTVGQLPSEWVEVRINGIDEGLVLRERWLEMHVIERGIRHGKGPPPNRWSIEGHPEAVRIPADLQSNDPFFAEPDRGVLMLSVALPGPQLHTARRAVFNCHRSHIDLRFDWATQIPSSNYERSAALAHLPLRFLRSSPGHARLRDRSYMLALASKLAAGTPLRDEMRQSILLNVFTSGT